MEYVAFVFGIFGLISYLQVSSLKGRIDALERQLAKMEGTSYREERMSLLQMVQERVGMPVKIDLKEDHEDTDIVMYGNTRHGSNTILDADEDWLLVRVEGPKGTKEKLIRMESVERIRTV